MADSQPWDIRLPHTARSFDALPGADEAAGLLAELATAPCRHRPVEADLPLALYGAGNLGRLARDYLKTVRRDFVIAIDRDAGRIARDPAWAGVRVLRPDEVPADEKCGVRLAVSVVTAPYVPLETTLRAGGFQDVVPFYDLAESFRAVHPLSNGWFAAPLSPEDRDRTAAVLARWDDGVSRAHHLQFLAWRRLREEWSFADAPVANDNRFFIPEVMRVLHEDEVFVDAGAHHGGVSEAFARQVNGAFRQIVAIEPDPANRARLLENFARRLPADARVAVHDGALSDTEGEAAFHDGLDYASQLSDTGRMRVMRCRLDSLALAPTFLKLHLEGAELLALKGARETLRKYRPIVAATVYHNDDGIWRTADWLMQALPGYRFLLRAHSWCGTGAVIYAIPRERAA
ncbi:MAG: FkbM family methyltransferase [Pseudolabrys sp.]